MGVKEYLKKTFKLKYGIMPAVRPHAVCADGFTLSIQASEFHYCFPRETLEDCDYNAVEVMLFGTIDSFTYNRFLKHSCGKEDGNLFSFVDIHFLELFVKEHGGIVNIN